MKRLMTIALSVAIILPIGAQRKQTTANGYPISPVPFTAVIVTPGTFLTRN